MIDLMSQYLIALTLTIFFLLVVSTLALFVLPTPIANRASTRITLTLRLSRASANYLLRYQLSLAKGVRKLSSDDRTDRIRAVISANRFCRTDLDIELLDLDEKHCTMVVYTHCKLHGLLSVFGLFTDFGRSRDACQLIGEIMHQYVIDRSAVRAGRLRPVRKAKEMSLACCGTLVYGELIPKSAAYPN